MSSKLIILSPCKNECETITAVLESVRTITDGYIVSIDSKDEQDTEKPVCDFFAQYDIPHLITRHLWQSNFSLMRNEMLEKAEAFALEQWGSLEKVYVLFLDGHESFHFPHVSLLKKLIEIENTDVDMYSLQIKMLDEDKRVHSTHPLPKLWKLDKGIRYGDRAVHNQIDLNTCPPERQRLVDLWIIHDRPMENAVLATQRRQDMVPKMLEEYKTNTDSMFHLLLHFMETNDQRYWEVYKDYNKESSPFGSKEIDYSIAIYTARMLLRSLGDEIKKKSEEHHINVLTQHILKELSWAANCYTKKNDHHIETGNLYYALEKYDQAIQSWEEAKRYEIPKGCMIAVHDEKYSWEPWALQAVAWQKKNENQQAWLCYYEALYRGGRNVVTNNILNCENYSPHEGKKQGNLNEISGESVGFPYKRRLYCIDKTGQFSPTFLKMLEDEFEIIGNDKQIDFNKLGQADIIHCDWSDDNLIFLSQVKRPNQLLTARLHGYENLEQNYGSQVIWENVDHLICVSKELLKYSENRFGKFNVKKHVITNPLDLSKMTYKKRKHGKNIGWVGFINAKKGVDLLVQIAKELPDYLIHIAGEIQDARVWAYLEFHMKTDTPNIIYEGKQSNIDLWLEGMNYLVTTSLFESFSYCTWESFAKGILVLSNTWVGWREFIPEDLVYNKISDIKKMVSTDFKYESERYRKMAERYSIENIKKQVLPIFKGEK